MNKHTDQSGRKKNGPAPTTAPQFTTPLPKSPPGDCFSCHAVDNPDLASEELLLEAYAPEVPASLRRRLALCFRDLRELHAAGVLSCTLRMCVSILQALESIFDVRPTSTAFDLQRHAHFISPSNTHTNAHPQTPTPSARPSR
jgi:hypothetical protein